MIKFRHNIVKVLCIYEHEHQASPSESTKIWQYYDLASMIYLPQQKFGKKDQ